MNVMESEFIDWLRARLTPHDQVPLGPGDDAAVLRITQRRDVVVTTDLLTDGVDFLLEQCAPQRVGRKAIAVNLSDLAAMAARPIAVFVSVALPRPGAAQLSRDLLEGMLDICDRYHVALAGGDTNTWSGGLVISVTAIGETTPRGPLRRDGARPGDLILSTGSFGGSILGKHFDFTPRVSESLWLHDRYQLHAGIDVSDGLSLDAARMAAESRCGAALALCDIPIDAAAYELARQQPTGKSPLEHALTDGEDFELLLCVPPQEAQRLLADQPLEVPITCIGRMVAQQGLWQSDQGGNLRPLKPEGFQHGAL